MNEEQIAQLVRVDDRSLRNEARIKKLEESNATLHELATSVAVMANQMETMNSNVATMQSDVADLKNKPAKKWDSIVDKVAWALIAAALGFILAQLGITG